MAVDLHTSLPSHFLPDDDDFLTDLTRFLLPDDHLHSGSREGSSQESSSPGTPCWKFEKERGKKHVETSNSGLDSHQYQSLIEEQIRAIELSGVKQEQESRKGKANGRGRGLGLGRGNGRRTPPARMGEGMRALFLDGPASTSRGGTGVFLPRAGPTSPNKQGKGCSTVLIPARVVQALQLRFDQMAATSGPKPAGFPPLHDVLVSNRHGMYSLQNRQPPKMTASVQNDTILPQEWTY